jgi:hypothetical protein
MNLAVTLGDAKDLEWAQQICEQHHYLRVRVPSIARPMVYVVWHDGWPVGLCIVASPHANRNRLWWGYHGRPTQWQVVDLTRIWLDPSIQQNGSLCRPGDVPGFVDRRGVFRPTTPTWLIRQVLQRVQQDRVSLWPPVFLDEPYHIRLVISYHDPAYHQGTIYRLSGAEPMYQDEQGRPLPSTTGKYGWVWRLERPAWDWQDIEIRRPRTVRMRMV